MSNHHDWVSTGAITFAGVAAVSLQQAAWIVTIIAGLISVVLGLVKLYDRFHGKPAE